MVSQELVRCRELLEQSQAQEALRQAVDVLAGAFRASADGYNQDLDLCLVDVIDDARWPAARRLR
jgi:hypothetical protein